MLKKRALIVCIGLFPALLTGISTRVTGQNQKSFPPLTFEHRDRVVLLGSSLFENELKEGYIEFSLGSRWPDREVTFRNLGWTGDNVFAEARSTFSSPPTAYQQLFQQIRSARPNYVLIAYGGIESQQGERGADQFRQGLERIIDSVDALGAKTILLSTIPVHLAGTAENTLIQNQNLKLYAQLIAETAAKKAKRYVDLYNPLLAVSSGYYLDNGIHLNAQGYYLVAQAIEKSFGWPARGEKFVINLGKQSASAEPPVKLFSEKEGKIRFSFEEKLLPLPVPATAKTVPEASLTVQINGLKKGYYTLTENGRQLVTASASDWSKGVTLNHGSSMTQSEKISDFIVKKNDLVFQQYRPLNRTYILGFRAYEQGRHKQGLQDLDFIITWLEGQINLHRKPVPKTYELTRLE